MKNSLFLDEIMDTWTKNFITRNLWRFKRTLEFDDLISEAWLVFEKVSRKYIDVSEKHFMSLYQRSLTNRFHDLARCAKKHETVDIGYDCAGIGENSLDNFISDEVSNTIMLENACIAGGEISAALRGIVSGDITCNLGRCDGRRETFNQHFDNSLKLPTGTNSAKNLREFLRYS